MSKRTKGRPDSGAPQLKITRVGGMLPTLRPSKTWALVELDEDTRAAVAEFVRTAPAAGRASHPDAMSYVFELSGDKPATVAVPYDAVPKLVRPLLPGPK